MPAGERDGGTGDWCLACEATARAGSVAVLDPTGVVVAESCPAAPAGAALVPALTELLRAYPQVTSLAVATGPGSFTGLRIAVVAVRTMAWLTGLPVRSVDACAALAAAQGPGCWVTCLSLKRDTTFHGCYEVNAAGQVTAVVASLPRPDAEGGLAVPAKACVIGPALSAKAEAVARWYPNLVTGSEAGVSARGVGLAARHSVPGDPANVLPDYRVQSAPELQRAAGIS